MNADDVERMNLDVSRLQDQARERFPERHPDRAYFDALRRQLPGEVSDTKVAEVLLAAKHAGIERVEQLATATLRGDQIFVAGTTPGFRARVAANAPAPDMHDSVYQTDQHNLVRAYDEQARQPPVRVQSP